MKNRAFAGGCKKVREKCKKGLHFAARYGKMEKTGLQEGRMKLVRWIKKHICSLAVIGATLLMLAVMLVPLFLPVDDLNGNGRSDAADLVLLDRDPSTVGTPEEMRAMPRHVQATMLAGRWTYRK